VRRVVAQSFASYRYAREGGPVKTEDDPLDPEPPRTMREGFGALRHLEEAVASMDGIVLRYGAFYGNPNDGMLEPVRKGRFPIVGDGGGMTSFVHLEDAASATVLAIEAGQPGIYNVCDDEPAPVRDWLPFMAETLGAKPPRRVPAFLARLLAGEAAVLIATEARAASNAKARRELGWALRYPSWRQGFPAVYGAPARDPAPVGIGRPHPSS
jgi:nucleoside-diphosphate-sugar epimerase